MTLIKSAIIAFSMYSRLPMPQFQWREKELKYALCFFPWVGAVIGAFTYVWWQFCERRGIGNTAWVLIGGAIPLLVTGGMHTDGFMDTLDAFHSYQPKERKLEILKDPHIGAFSVIYLLIYYLLYLGAYSEIGRERGGMFAVGFFLSRVLSGMGAVSLPPAKEAGLLYLFSNHAHKRVVKASLILQFALAACLLLSFSLVSGAAVLLGNLAAYVFYSDRCRKELGGITGDTAGYFLTLCEGVTAALLAVCSIFGIR